MSEDRRAAGRLGERLAGWFLERRGWRVVERNARVGRFEADLVVERGGERVLVEVKWRGRGARYGGLESLSPAQRRRLAWAAAALGASRIDLVTLDESDTRLVLEHHADAFGSGGELR